MPHINRAVIKCLSGLPNFPRLKVLDLSCGEGVVLSFLQQQGCDAEGTHYKEGDYIIKNRENLGPLRIRAGVDLHRPLPFPDASYDVVLMVEVLEHLEWHGHVVREAGRLLRPGGYFIFTTPNIFRLHSRLQFFLTGKHKLIRRRTGWDLAPHDLYAYHITPVDFPLMHSLLHQAGLGITQLRSTKIKPIKTALSAPLFPLVWLACRLTHDRKIDRNPEFVAGEDDLNRWLTHPALLFSEQLFVVAKKHAPSRV